MLSNDRNRAGKRYDANRPYDLVIHVTKGDAKGDILARMARGTVACYHTAESAAQAMSEFLRLASAIPGEFATYGVAAIVSNDTGRVLDSVAL